MNFSREPSGVMEWVQSTLERAAESPKTTVVASTVSTTAGVAIASQWITSLLGLAAAAAGIIATLLLARTHWLKGNQHELEIEILRRKLKETEDVRREEAV